MDDRSEALAVFLDALAEHPESALSLSEIAGRASLGASSEVVLELLRALGVVQSASNGAMPIGPIGPSARYFLRSLAVRIRSGPPMLGNWERSGAIDLPFTLHQMPTGPQLLYLSERQRLDMDADAPTLRSASIVQVLVKVGNREGGNPRYLLLYDQSARQYQLPGGHVRATDPDDLSAALRELEEELPAFHFAPAVDKLIDLGKVCVSQPSKTFGALTEYRIRFFLLSCSDGSVNAGPGGRWVTETALLSKETVIEGTTLNVEGLRLLDSQLPGGIAGLPRSTALPLATRIGMLARDRRWELLGLAIGLVGLAVSLIPLLS